MKYVIQIPRGDALCCYFLLPSGNFQRIDCDGIVILDIWKVHNHNYSFQGFFYARKCIVVRGPFGTKKELFGAIQKVLQELL